MLSPNECEILRKAAKIMLRMAGTAAAENDFHQVVGYIAGNVMDHVVMYAVGNTNEEGQWGYIDGPNPSLNDMLESIPVVINENHSPFYVVRLTEETPKKLYKWNVEEQRWKKLKQKP